MSKIFHRVFNVWLPNLVLVVGLVLLIRFNLTVLAFALLIISKWQILLGGPKAWLRNVRASGCELIVGLSAVTALVLAGDDHLLQIAVAVSYALWLLVIKPLAGSVWVAAQAGICLLAGMIIIFLLGRAMPELAVIALSWLVALVSADHFLSIHHEPAAHIISLTWALVVAEISWLLWRWLIVYSLFNGRLLMPQAPLVVIILGYTAGNIYLDHAHKKLRRRALLEYVAVAVVLLLVIIIGTRWDTRL